MFQDAFVKPYGIDCVGLGRLGSKEGKSRGGAKQRGLVRRRKAISISQESGVVCFSKIVFFLDEWEG